MVATLHLIEDDPSLTTIISRAEIQSRAFWAVRCVECILFLSTFASAQCFSHGEANDIARSQLFLGDKSLLPIVLKGCTFRGRCRLLVGSFSEIGS